VSFQVTLSDLAKYSVTRSVARCLRQLNYTMIARANRSQPASVVFVGVVVFVNHLLTSIHVKNLDFFVLRLHVEVVHSEALFEVFYAAQNLL